MKHYDLSVLQCPVCDSESLTESDDALVCSACDREYPVKEGIPLLMEDQALATRLEEMDYNEHHNIDQQRLEKVSRDWDEVLTRHNVKRENVLEIGSGTGQLTWGLATEHGFTSISACDLSHTFLQGIATNLLPDNRAVRYYACDANDLPFRDDQFDLVVGHSVLHHFVNYDDTIRKIHRILKAGGRAIFYEPVIQGKIRVAFMMDLMLRIDYNTQWGMFTDEEKTKIKHNIRHIKKAFWIGEDRERLAKHEDKHIFNIHRMRELAETCGYSGFEHSDLEEAVWGFKPYWAQELLMIGIAPEKIEKFAFIARSFGETFSNLVNEDVRTPMGYFVFIK